MQPTRQRLVSLDAVRGVALLGILVVNLPAMTQPLVESGLPAAGDWLDVLAWIPIKWAFETKFMVLFSLLFGMGAALQSERGGEGFRRLFLRRMGLLALIGLTHAALLWSGDILAHYALVGLFVPMLHRLPDRTLLPLVAALLGIPWLVTTVGHAAVALAGAESTPLLLEVGPAWLRVMGAGGFDPRSAAFQAAETWVWSYGDVADQLLLRAGTWAGFQGVLLLTLQPLRTLGIFLLGARLWRAGLFRQEGSRLRRRLATLGLGVGLPLEAAVIALHLFAGLDEAHPLAVLAESVHTLSGLGVGLGLAAGLAEVAGNARWSALFAPFAKAGRMALTFYLTQSVAGLAIVGAVGFGVLHRAWHLPVAIAVVSVQLGLAAWWLSRFRMGPVEWLWRAGTYGRFPKILGPAR